MLLTGRCNVLVAPTGGSTYSYAATAMFGCLVQPEKMALINMGTFTDFFMSPSFRNGDLTWSKSGHGGGPRDHTDLVGFRI